MRIGCFMFQGFWIEHGYSRGTRIEVYGISAIPLGGYVRVTGMHQEEFHQRVEDLREQEAEEAARPGVQTMREAEVLGTGAGDSSGQLKSRKPRDPEEAVVAVGERVLGIRQRRFHVIPFARMR